jgi:hypothetical protein
MSEAEKVEQLDRRELLSQQFDDAQQQVEATPAETVQTAPVQEPQVEPPVWERPPTSWKKDYHEVWTTADPKLKEYAWQREEEMKRGVEPLLSKAQFADQIQQAIEPYQNNLKSLGIEPPQAIKALMDADNVLRHGTPQQKAQMFASLSQQYGVNLGEIGNLQQQPVDPTVSALQNELYSVKNEVMTWKQQQEAAQNQALLGEIDTFAQKAEFFEDARPTMIQLLNSGMAQNLEDAYNKALRLDEALSSKLQQSQQAQAEAAKRESANKAAKAARAAAVSVRSSTPGVNTATKAQDRRSLLAEQIESLNGRF